MAYPTPLVAGDQLPAADLNDFLLNPAFTYGESLSTLDVVYLKAADSKIYKALGTNETHFGAFAGVVITTGVLNDTKRILGVGQVVTGASGLTAGSPVYIAAAGGAATATVGSFQIGVAISTTAYIIMPKNEYLVGEIKPIIFNTVPTGFLLCDASAVSRTTYATLFAKLFPTIGTFTVTIASPGVVTLTSHGLQTADAVYLTTTGALPTGLSANTRYWVIRVDANTFNLASSQANALAGTAINTSGSQSGTHTANLAPAGVGDGSTTFNLPDLRGVVLVGKNTSDTQFAGLGEAYGEKTHVLTVAELPAHTHGAPVDNSITSGSARAPAGTNGAGTQLNTSSTGSDAAHNNIQPSFVINWIIKF